MPSKDPSQPSKKQQFDSYIRYSGMAFQLFAAIFIGVWGGMRLDAWLHTGPWLTVLCSLLGICAGMYAVLHDFLRKK
ncbi:MAG: AtpZ/AtpI family protein [Chitinophagales bacterium]